VKRRAFVLSAAALAVAPAWGAERFERGLLWRITKPGHAPSHVFGTIHDADARVVELPAPAAAAFASARTLLVEFLPDAYTRERFTEAAGALLNLRHPAVEAPESLDARLIGRARARRLAVFQMEGVEEQIFAFDECPMETQVALLKHSLAHRDELAQLEDETIHAYLARDLAAIWRLRQRFIARYPEVAAHQAIMTQRLLYDRSVVMAYRVQQELRRGDAFVAVGALHLHGAKGVLALLEADGYRATRVY